LDSSALRKLLDGVRSGKISIDAAEELLKDLPFADLGFATVDLHRPLRRGFPETVYGEGKTVRQIVAIVRRIHGAGQTALVTRVDPRALAAIKRALPRAEVGPLSRTVVVRAGRKEPGRPGVLVMTAGTTDLPVAEEAAITAELMGEAVVRVNDVGVSGLHRLLARRKEMSERTSSSSSPGWKARFPRSSRGSSRAPSSRFPRRSVTAPAPAVTRRCSRC
jgi:NCAIR mutase (PurE)-related protein